MLKEKLAVPLNKRIGEYSDFPYFNGIPQIYVMLGVARSGTYVLCEGLYSTGLAGQPHEYDLTLFRDQYIQRWNEPDPEALLRLLFAHRTSPNGVFGMKILASQLDQAELLPLVNMLRPSYVVVLRNSKIDQGISKYKAVQSKIWNSTSQYADSRKLSFNDYNFIGIFNSVIQCIIEETALLHYINAHKNTKLILTYEDFQDNPAQAVQHILQRAVGIDYPLEAIQLGHMKKQRDELSDYFRQKFLADFAKLSDKLPEDQVAAVKAGLRRERPGC